MTYFPSFTRAFLKLSLANILSNLLVPLAGLVDTAFLGRLAEIHHLGGVALATILFNYIYWSFGFLRMGTTGLTAQAVGAKARIEEGTMPIGPQTKVNELWLILGRNGAIALLLGVLILLLQLPLQRLGFALLNASGEIQQAGVAFFQGRIWGAPATLLNFVLLGWFLGQGQGRRVLLLSAIANGANVLLDYWMIVQLGWAGFGAGLATAMSQYAMLLPGLGWVVQDWRWLGQQGRSPLLPEFYTQLWQPTAFRRLFQLNRDILIRTLALVTAFSLFTNWSASLGVVLLATNTLLLQAISFAAYFIDGLAFAAETFAGQFVAAQQFKQLRSLLNLGLSLSIALGLSFALSFIAFPGLFSLLTHHDAVLRELPGLSLWLLPVLGIGSVAYFLDGYFLGLTAGTVLRNASLLAVGLFFVPLAWLAQHQENISLLWLALCSLMVGRSLTLIMALRRQ